MPNTKYKDFRPVSFDKFSSIEIGILDRNSAFFSSNPTYLKLMLDIINQESNISIRVLDHLISNYSKRKNIAYKIKTNGVKVRFCINGEYKNQLNGYSKRYFDPFCRKKKVIYFYNKTNENKPPEKIKFLTSIGQLNFFHWAIKNKVIRYAEYHLEQIEQDMKNITKYNKKRKNTESVSTDSETEVKKFLTIIDDDICSNTPDDIKMIYIGPSSTKSSEKKPKRQQLPKSFYSKGIKKSTASIKLDFD